MKLRESPDDEIEVWDFEEEEMSVI